MVLLEMEGLMADNNKTTYLFLTIILILSAFPIYIGAQENNNSPTNASDKPQEQIEQNINFPIHQSIMFNDKDTGLISKLVNALINSQEKNDSKKLNTQNDDMNDLLDKVKGIKKVVTHEEPVYNPPNIYVGSILYYSAKDWSVWINGNKYGNEYNNDKNDFYISKISRKEVEFVWKLRTSIVVSNAWQKLVKNGDSPKNIDFDSKKNSVTLLMRANQTFIPSQLVISEGFIKSGYMPITDNKKTEKKHE